MRVKRLKKKIISLVLVMICIFSYIGESSVLIVQAKENGLIVQSEINDTRKSILSVGHKACAVIKRDKNLWMWGSNSSGALGIDDYRIIYRVPEKVIDHVKSVCVSSGTAVIKDDNSLWVCGSVGFPDKDFEMEPWKAMEGVKMVSLAKNPSYPAGAVIKQDGSLWTWGNNEYGQLGNGSIGEEWVLYPPTEIMKDVRFVSMGSHTGAAIKTDGSLWVWGMSFDATDEAYASKDNGKPIKILDDVVTVSVDLGCGAAVKNDGSLWMWGGCCALPMGQYNPEVLSKPIQVMEDVATVSIILEETAVIKQDGSLWTWGVNEGGVLGNGTTEASNIPTQIMDNVVDVCLGDLNGAAIQEDGSLWTWGSNAYCQLGDGTTKDSLVPIQTMPAGSIAVSDLGMNIGIFNKPRVKVVDEKNMPIAGAKVTHLGNTLITDEKGFVILEQYKQNETITIAKENYNTIIETYKKQSTGCTTYVLSDIGSIILKSENEQRDVSHETATINRYDKTDMVSIVCSLYDSAKYDLYELYSGTEKIAENNNGTFMQLRKSAFTESQPVFLKIRNSTDHTYRSILLSIQVIDLNPNQFEISMGEDFKISIPENVPLVGGTELCANLVEDMPVEVKASMDGTLEVMFNMYSLNDNEKKEMINAIKNQYREDYQKLMNKIGKPDKKPGVDPDFDLDFKIAGYIESNVSSWDHLKGKLLVELSAEGAWEKQGSITTIPVVVELSVEGKINADGSITLSMENGLSGSLEAGGEFWIGLYGGVGVKDLISGGVYGKGGMELNVNLLPADIFGVDKLCVKGEAGVKGKFLGKDVGQWKLIEGTYYIIPKEANRSSTAVFSIDNDNVYENLSRSYLNADGSMRDWTSDASADLNGNVEERALQGETCFDIVPQIVRMGDTVMLFYLTDAGAERGVANRSMLVYSLWDKASENWSEPKAVLDDGTADFTPDLYSDGEKIYAVWQNATENLTEGLTLNETAERLTLHVAVYDEVQDQFMDLGALSSENGLFQQSPQIVADGDEVSVYWYENAEDNVLGLSGTNRIYRAVLQDTENAAQQAAIQSVEDIEEPEENEESREEETPAEEEEPETENPTVSGNDMNSASAFREFVALEEEIDQPEEEAEPEASDEENKEKTEESEEESDQEAPTEGREEADQEESTEETEESVSENTVSGNSISENTLQSMTYGIEEQTIQPWNISLVQTEDQCIFSADAGKSNGKTGYAYAAGKLGDQFEISQGRVVFLAQDGTSLSVGEGETGSVAFTSVYSGETLTWYQNGDIHYLAEDDTETALFGESRLPSSTYTLMSDGAGHPEVIFPVNMDGKSNLYRIGYENGAFQAALQVTDQEDYIQYADGFIDGSQTILVYNRMKVNDALEEVNNSLCTGTLAHSYSDIVLQSAGSMVRQEEESGENVLEITAQLYNNGTEKIENLSLTLAKADGTALETVPVDSVLESGETAYVSANFAPEQITEEADYTVFVTVSEDNNAENNSAQIRLGAASLQVNAQMISISDKRMMQVGIQNTGVTACGGIISVRDTETGKEYCNSDFEPIAIGQTVFAEIEIDQSVFNQKDVVVLEAVVIPDAEGLEAVSDFVTTYAPTYAVTFVTDTEESTVYVGYGKTAAFPKNPAKDGAHFAGWYDTQDATGGILYTEEMPIKSDVTLYARFVQEQTSIPLGNCSVTEIPTQLYTGKALKPAVTVKWGSEVLKAKKDYTVSYQNNKEQGTAMVTITGKGKYTGSITRRFLIKYDMNKVSVSKIPAVNFTGENHTPDVTVTYNKKTLVKNIDYTVTYANNRNAGTAGITLTGKGKYTGTKTVTFQIKGTSITGMVFDKIPDVIYNGSSTRPIVTVKTKDGTQLMPGADYRLAYENTVNKGTATVTVIGNGNYTGTKKLTYKVVAKPLTEAMISGIEDAVYTGSLIKPVVTVKDGGAELAAGKDYTVSYSKNKAVGTGTVTVKGKGNYSGMVKLPFAIQKCSLEDNAQISVQVSDIAYTGKAVKPKVQVYEGSKKLPASGYSVSYDNNIEMGTGTVTVTGKGSYTGTVTAQFRIVEKAKLITSLRVGKIADAVYTGTAIEPDVTVTDGAYTLVKGMDYELSYKNQYNAGKATVTVKGIGSYAGSKDVAYKISKRAVGNKTVLGEGFEIGQISDERYTGYAMKPDVVVKDQGKTLVPGTDYKLSYRNNTKIGIASVTLTGIGNYSGSYNAISFNIVSWNYSDLQAQIEDQVYTGKALKPQVAFYTGGEAVTLKPGTAVKVVYKDNKNAGTATATITGKGELKDMTPVTVSFEIEPADIADAVVSRIPNQTMKGVAVKPIPKVKVGKSSLKAGRDFTVSYLRNGVKGEAEVIITGIGNYTGEFRKSFTVQ